MVLDAHRKEADFLIAPVARKLINVNPNMISWMGLIVALASGIILFYSSFEGNEYLLLVGAFVVLLSGYFDALDGKVAKLSNRCSKKGDYLDHVFDRYADMFMIGGIAVSSWCYFQWGMLALVGTLLTSYMGTQAQAIGAPRLYAGLLGRADRVVFLFIFPIIQYITCCFGVPSFSFSLFGCHYTYYWIEFMIIYFAIVGNFTAIQRAIVTWKNMSKDEETFGVQKQEPRE